MKKRKSTGRDADQREMVFVVDDNATLVQFATLALESAGYAVNGFCDPKAALRAMGETDPKPAVLVTDYEMGEMNGLELIRSSHKIHPSLKTVLLSGTVDSSITLKDPATVHRFLGKPCNAAELQEVVAGLIKK